MDYKQLVGQGRKALEEGEFDKSLDFLKKALSVCPNDNAKLILYAGDMLSALNRKGDYDGVLKLAEDVLSLKTTHYGQTAKDNEFAIKDTAYAIKSRAYFDKKEWDNVVKNCTETIKVLQKRKESMSSQKEKDAVDRRIAKYFSMMGKAKGAQKDAKTAIKYFEKSLEYSPENEDAIFNLAISHQYDEIDKALEYAFKLKKMKPEKIGKELVEELIAKLTEKKKAQV